MNRGRALFSLLGCVAAVLLALPTSAFAQDQAPAPSAAPDEKPVEPKIDEQVQKILKQVTDSLGKAKTLGYKVAASLHIEGAGMKQDMESKYDVAVERPNKLALRYEGMPTGMTLVSDGKDLYTYIGMLKQYTVETAPEDLRNYTDPSSGATMSPEGGLVMALAAPDPYGAMIEGVTEGTYGGKETIDGRETHKLSFKENELDWDLWVTAADSPRIVRMKPDMGKLLQQQVPNMPEMKINMDLRFADWIVGGKLPEEVFKFTPPDDATKVAAFDMGGQGGEPHALVGKPAPAFNLDTLDGKKADLASLKDKVVILDFWATWCGPCREGLPVVNNLAKEYADKGVVLFAVNLREDPETIKAFLENQKLKVPVALDTEGSVGDDYGVDGIPQTVIIDKKGIVHEVHVGVSPNFKEDLKATLDSALAGTPKETPAAQ